jgi:hypothetical protein
METKKLYSGALPDTEENQLSNYRKIIGVMIFDKENIRELFGANFIMYALGYDTVEICDF